MVYMRTIPEYTQKELRKIKLDKETFSYWYDDMEIKIYKDREEDIVEIMKICDDRKTIKIMIVSRTQSGKTYILLRVVKNIVEEGEIPLDNIYIITGLNSCDWKEQTKKRFPMCCGKNILHLSDIQDKLFVETLKNKKNVRILIDESQVACRDKQTLHNQFDKIGLRDYKYLYENNIQIIETSATPAGTLVDMLDNNFNDECPESNKIYTLNKTNNYIGIEDGMQDGTLLQSISLYQPSVSSILQKYNNAYKKEHNTADDLYTCEDKDTIQSFIMDITDDYHYNNVLYTDADFINKINQELDYGFMPQQIKTFLCYYKDNVEITDMLRDIKQYTEDFGKKSYVFIRTQVGAKQDRVLHTIQKEFPQETYDYEYYDQHSSFNLDTLKIEPKKTTFVLIKEKCRCSQTLHKEFISVGYERLPQKITSDDPQAQGLYARIKTGYDVNPKSVCYCNIESCEALLKTEENGYDMTGFKSASLDTKGRSKGTYNKDKEDDNDDDNKPANKITTYKWGLKTKKEVSEFCKKEFNKEYKPQPRTNNEGFYITKWLNKVAVRTKEDIIDYTDKLGRMTQTGFCAFPYYDNILDKESLNWVICWKQKSDKEPEKLPVKELKAKSDRIECEFCKCSFRRDNRSSHNKSKRHISNTSPVATN